MGSGMLKVGGLPAFDLFASIHAPSIFAKLSPLETKQGTRLSPLLRMMPSLHASQLPCQSLVAVCARCHGVLATREARSQHAMSNAFRIIIPLRKFHQQLRQPNRVVDKTLTFNAHQERWPVSRVRPASAVAGSQIDVLVLESSGTSRREGEGHSLAVSTGACPTGSVEPLSSASGKPARNGEAS